ncbi:MAG: hypothetical protein H6807_07285 [Planctomycetes bacterium]|nr:hypothetical protein [Planctomycetota bacterium]
MSRSSYFSPRWRVGIALASLALLLLFTMVSIPSSAAGRVATLQIRIVDMSGVPIPGATVTIADSFDEDGDGAYAAASATTDAAGIVSFSTLAFDDWVFVSVTKQGTRTLTREIYLPTQTAQLDLSVAPAFSGTYTFWGQLIGSGTAGARIYTPNWRDFPLTVTDDQGYFVCCLKGGAELDLVIRLLGSATSVSIQPAADNTKATAAQIPFDTSAKAHLSLTAYDSSTATVQAGSSLHLFAKTASGHYEDVDVFSVGSNGLFGSPVPLPINRDYYSVVTTPQHEMAILSGNSLPSGASLTCTPASCTINAVFDVDAHSATGGVVATCELDRVLTPSGATGELLVPVSSTTITGSTSHVFQVVPGLYVIRVGCQGRTEEVAVIDVSTATVADVLVPVEIAAPDLSDGVGVASVQGSLTVLGSSTVNQVSVSLVDAATGEKVQTAVLEAPPWNYAFTGVLAHKPYELYVNGNTGAGPVYCAEGTPYFIPDDNSLLVFDLTLAPFPFVSAEVCNVDSFDPSTGMAKGVTPAIGMTVAIKDANGTTLATASTNYLGQVVFHPIPAGAASMQVVNANGVVHPAAATIPANVTRSRSASFLIDN